jgi:uncharacterized protein (TIGR03437 family)
MKLDLLFTFDKDVFTKLGRAGGMLSSKILWLPVALLLSLLSSTAVGQSFPILTSQGLPPGTPATSVNVGQISGVGVDAAGNVFMTSFTFSVVLRLDVVTGFLTVVAGNGTAGFSGDNGPATSAQLYSYAATPMGVAIDPTGNLYIADTGNHRVRKVSNGVITTIAGNGTLGFSGDNGPATSAQLNEPMGVAVDSAGNVYISDFGNNRIRRVSNGMITTVAGGGTASASLGDNGPAAAGILFQPIGIAVDSAGNLYIADNQHGRIRKVTNGTITTVAGNGGTGRAGDNGPATSAPLTLPQGVAVDSAGNIYIAEAGANRVRKVSNGVITTIAGLQFDASGVAVGVVDDVDLYNPLAVAVDSAGNVYIRNLTLLKLSNGVITTVADEGPIGLTGYPCSNIAPPVITSVRSASAYGGYSYFASGSWLEIKGTNLADPADPRLKAATNPGQWTSGDFNGVNAPIVLDGVSVSINGKQAYVWYLSPTQLNVQAPEDSATGNVTVNVTNCQATSSAFAPPYIAMRHALAPGFLAPANYSAGGTQYMVATFASDGAYVLSTNAGAALGLKSRPAKPGDVIIAYGIGFGDVTPSILPGVIAQQSNTLVNPVTVSFGSTPAVVSYSGLAGGFVGLYEFYITVPPTLADGDYQINVTQSGALVPQTMYLTVHN